MKRLLAVATLASVLLLTGCAAGEASRQDITQGDPGTMQSQQSESGMSDTAQVAPDAASGSSTLTRSVIQNASVAVAVDKPLEVAPQLAEIATAAGGYVQDSSGSPANEAQAEVAYATLRVPADKLESVTDEVLGLGTFVSSNTSATDVTLQVTDVNARIASLTTSINRLTALMAGATTTADLLTAETALTQRQAELDSLVSQRDYLADQVDLATVSVSLLQTYDTAATSQTFWDGLAQGWSSLVNVGSVLVVAFGFLLPWFAVLAVVAAVAGLIVWVIVRAAHSRRGAVPHSKSEDSSQS
jgi:uncharacterized small protein (DUF1192 family)